MLKQSEGIQLLHNGIYLKIFYKHKTYIYLISEAYLQMRIRIGINITYLNVQEKNKKLHEIDVAAMIERIIHHPLSFKYLRFIFLCLYNAWI